MTDLEREQRKQEQKMRKEIEALGKNRTEVGCMILDNPTMSDLARANAGKYLYTGRIREWKPVDNTKLTNTDRYAYCFIDNDDDRGKDVLFESVSCSSNDRLFENHKDFIEVLGNDGAMERSRRFPYNKCVLKIDKDRVSKEKLERFWRDVEVSDCDRLFNGIRQSNGAFVEQNNECTESNNILNNEISALTREKLQLQQERDRLIDLNRSLSANLQVRTNDYNASKASYDERVAHRDHLASSYTGIISQLTEQRQNCMNRFTTVQRNLAHVNDEYSKMVTHYNHETIEYNKLRLAYSNLFYQNSVMESELKTLRTSNPILIIDRSNCETNYANTLNLLKDCSSNYSSLKIHLENMQFKYNDCANRRTDIKEDIKAKTTERNHAFRERNTLQTEYSQCFSKNGICITDQSERQVEHRDLENIIKNWKTKDCRDDELKLKMLQGKKDDMMKNCKNDFDRMTSLQQQVNELKKQAITAKSSQAQACIANKGLFTNNDYSITTRMLPQPEPPKRVREVQEEQKNANKPPEEVPWFKATIHDDVNFEGRKAIIDSRNTSGLRKSADGKKIYIDNPSAHGITWNAGSIQMETGKKPWRFIMVKDKNAESTNISASAQGTTGRLGSGNEDVETYRFEVVE